MFMCYKAAEQHHPYLFDGKCWTMFLWGQTNHLIKNGWYEQALPGWIVAANGRLNTCKTAQYLIYVPERGTAWLAHYTTPALFISTACTETQTLLYDGSCHNSQSAKQMGQEMKRHNWQVLCWGHRHQDNLWLSPLLPLHWILVLETWCRTAPKAS